MPKAQLIFQPSAGPPVTLCTIEITDDKHETSLLRLLQRTAGHLVAHEMTYLLEQLTDNAGKILTLMEQLPDLDNYQEITGFFDKLKKARKVFEPFRLPVAEANLYLKGVREKAFASAGSGEVP